MGIIRPDTTVLERDRARLELHERALGHVGDATTMAVREFRRGAGIALADGHARVKLLARLRQGL